MYSRFVFVLLTIRQHSSTEIFDTTLCKFEESYLDDDQVPCLKHYYDSIEDFCTYQPMVYKDEKSYCSGRDEKGFKCFDLPCRCHDRRVDCDRQKPISFPAAIDPSYTRLYASKLSLVLTNDTPVLRYNRLEYLDLSYNHVQTLWPSMFRYLSNLVALNLRNDRIVDIDADAFRGLRNLRILNLDNNRIRAFQFDTFRTLENLVLLSLKNNTIVDLADSVFNGLKNLKVLDLSHNALNYLTSYDLPTPNLKVLRARGNYIKITNFDTRELLQLEILDLSFNSIQSLSWKIFRCLPRLKILNLKYNEIGTFSSFDLQTIYEIVELDLRHNNITRLTENLFHGMKKLKILHLECNSIEYMEQYTFNDLNNLKELYLVNNKITRLKDNTFAGLKNLKYLNIRGNPFVKVDRHVFKPTPLLQHLRVDEDRYCCLALHASDCQSTRYTDEFASCRDLMSNIILRICIWTLGIIAIISNTFVIVFRTINKTANPAHSFLIKNLALSDLLMGVYLLIIASTDMYYRGVYRFFDLKWRRSNLCNFAGFLSTFSSELTVFTLTVITLDRFCSIAYPFHTNRLEIRRTRLLMLFGWIIAFIIAMIPLPIFQIEYFKFFYGRSSVCLPLHITKDKVHGWEYSVVVFIILNAISFVIIVGCYISMYQIVNKTRKKVHINSEYKTQQKIMAKRMTTLVLASAGCWIPIIILGLRSLAGYRELSRNVYAWIAVFVLPLNAALNPILYTLSLIPSKRTYLRKILLWKTN